MFLYSMTRTINKPTKVTANTASVIRHIIMCISDPFAIVLDVQVDEKRCINKLEQYNHKQILNETSIAHSYCI